MKSKTKYQKIEDYKPKKLETPQMTTQMYGFPRNVRLDVNILEEKTTPSPDDLLLLRDSTTSTRKKVKYSNL